MVGVTIAILIDMYYLIGIKHPFSGDVDILDKDPSYDVLARIKRVADMALKSDDLML